MKTSFLAAAIPALGMLALDALAATTTTVVDLPAPSGGQQRFLYMRPDAPIANIVHLPGGSGDLGILDGGAMITEVAACSPINRDRDAWAARGYSVAFVSATSLGVVRDFADIQEVVRHMRARDNVPVWIVGGSASTAAVANVTVNLPATTPVGTVFYSPGRPSGLVSTITRPTLVVNHALDTEQFGSAMFNALAAARVKERVVVTGGSGSGCGYHLYNGSEAAFLTGIDTFIKANNALTAGAGINVQGLWWKSPAESESGWGLNLTHQGDTLFATWFTYDTDGSQMWLVGPAVTLASGTTYSGTLYRTTGPAFNSVPFGAIAANPVGTVTLTFADSGNGTFGYTVNGVTQSKAITRQNFSTVPTCSAGGSPAATLNFSDLWYRAPAESEPGWGVNLSHQGNIVFATWFTYDAAGRGMWVVGPALQRTSGNNFTGALYRTTGPAFSASPWTPAGVVAMEAGSATFSFTANDAGTFSYTLNGVSQAKAITRQAFATPATVCR